MTIDRHDVVRRAFDEIIDAAGELGPCPTIDRQSHAVDGRPDDVPDGPDHLRPGADRSSSRPRVWGAIAAGLLLMVGLGSIAFVVGRPDTTTPADAGRIDLGPIDQFPVGSVTRIDDPALFVVNDQGTGIVVFDARSTHLECILVANTDADDGVVDPEVGFVDPCHGSRFDTAGNKLAGPAPRSMDRYPVTITNGRLLVDPAQRITGNPATAGVYSGVDLDATLPTVGRAWADSMDFSLEPDTNARLYDAWQTAIANCMHTEGFADYTAITFPPNGNYQDLVNPLDRRYATVMGYHELPALPDDPNLYTDATYAALDGADGCTDSAYAETFGRISTYTSLNDELRNGVAEAIDGFPESVVGTAATTAWAACMSELGYSFQSRVDAVNSYAGRPTISAEEIETRLDDLDCDMAVQFTRQQHDWEQAQIDVWRQTNVGAIAEAVRQKQRVQRELAEIETAVRRQTEE